MAMPMGHLERVPPQNLEAEQSVLGCMLLQKEAVARALDLLRPEDFYRDTHRAVFEAMRELFERGQPVDLITVSDALRGRGQLEAVGGLTYLTELANVVPTAANLEYYARIVRERSLLRGIIAVGTTIAQKAYEPGREAEEILDEAEQMVFALSERTHGTSYEPLKDVLIDTVSKIDRLYDSKAGITGVPTGFSDLDELTAGWQNSDLVVLAARPSMGKTQLALNLARNAAAAGVTTAYFALEMSKEQLALRLVCAEGHIDSQKLRRGQLQEEDWKRFSVAVGQLSRLPIFIDDTPALTPLELRARARRLKAEHNLGFLIVDYLQLMEVGRARVENRQQEISIISRTLKALARELSIPVLALSQLSRAVDSRQDRRPLLSDLRESGAIEQDADIVAFIYREQYYQRTEGVPDIAEVIIAKHRNGPTGVVRLHYAQQFGRFYLTEERYGDG
jgi:replicative DNA helicase